MSHTGQTVAAKPLSKLLDDGSDKKVGPSVYVPSQVNQMQFGEIW